jgi:RNA polymerase sigma-70 factor (ECF subfamily)
MRILQYGRESRTKVRNKNIVSLKGSEIERFRATICQFCHLHYTDWKMLKESELIEECIRQKRQAQYTLYERYASTMLSVCLRYSKNREEAEDLLQEGFLKVFDKIATFRGQGSLEGWIRRIMTNNALNHLKARKLNFVEEDPQRWSERLPDETRPDGNEELYSPDVMLKAVQKLPDGYRVVFNLYVFEGFSHREIAESLSISENTSKSQLSRARRYLRNLLTGNVKD